MKLPNGLPDQAISPFRLTELTIRGLGSYLHGTRLKLRPLTILCGTNGSGKSTWIRMLNTIRESCRQGTLPFELPDDIEANNYQYTNAHLCQQYPEYCPQSCGADEEFGPPGTFGLSFLAVKDYGKPLEHEPKDSIVPITTLSRFLSDGFCPKGTNFRVLLTCGEAGISSVPLERGFELRIDDYRMKFKVDPESKNVEVFCTRSFLTGSSSDTELVPLLRGRIDMASQNITEVSADDHKGLAFCQTCIDKTRTLLEAVTAGYFHIGAIREICNIARTDWTKDDLQAVSQRHVGNKGQYVHHLYAEYFLNRMRRLPDVPPQTGQPDIRKFNLHDYYSEWLYKLIRVWVNLNYDLYDVAPKSNPSPGYLSDYEPAQFTKQEKDIYDNSEYLERYVALTFDEIGLPAAPSNMSSGFHQVAPMIMQTGLMKMYELCAIENPEVHLHPRLQLDITEFLISQADIGKFILIETHSDLIIRRTLRAILEETISQQNVNICFTSITSPDDGMSYSELKNLDVDEHGRISNWPPGFLDDDIGEAHTLLDRMYGHTDDKED